MRFPPYPKYKPSGVEWLGYIPDHWEVKRIKHVLRIKSGEAPPEDKSATSGEYPIYGANGIIGYCGSINSDVERILIGRVGAIGAVNIAPPRVWISDNALILLQDHLRISQKFLLAMVSSLDLKIESTTNAQPLITATQVKRQIFALPPLTEQCAIADFLDAQTAKLDTLVARKRGLIERLKEKRSAVISRTVTRGLPPEAARAAGWNPNPKLKPSGIEWLGEIPEYWEVVQLFRITETIQTGPFGSQLHQSDYVDGGIPLINPSHLVNGSIVPDDEETVTTETAKRLARHSLMLGDVIFARRGEIGRCAVIGEMELGWLCGTGSMVVRLRDCDPRYFARVFRSAGFSALLTLNAVGTTMLNLNPSIVGRN